MGLQVTIIQAQTLCYIHTEKNCEKPTMSLDTEIFFFVFFAVFEKPICFYIIEQNGFSLLFIQHTEQIKIDIPFHSEPQLGTLGSLLFRFFNTKFIFKHSKCVQSWFGTYVNSPQYVDSPHIEFKFSEFQFPVSLFSSISSS